jgi:predicted transcriptional regulator/ribosomal protein S18 acetylase RimI-like enzyme
VPPLSCTDAQIRPFEVSDTDAVTALLHELPLLYPGAEAWLAARLADCAAGQAWAWVAVEQDEIVGVVIASPKGDRLKISNMFVREDARGRGHCRRLMRAASELWADGSRREVLVTVAPQNFAGVAACVAPYGLKKVATVRDRYGPGRHEIVLAWRPPTALLALHARHASRIYAGAKIWEFRRVKAALFPGTRVFIYESAGVGVVTGEFVVAERRIGTPKEVVILEPNEQSRQDAAEYLRGATAATALRTSRVLRYDRPKPLRDYGVVRAPQSYMLLADTAN